MPDYVYIDSDAELKRFCVRLNKAKRCAIDTEFVRESTYYPDLALVQVALDDELVCIDPLPLTDSAPLAEALTNSDLLKVFHSSTQDLEILFQNYGQVPTPVFDTQLAAAVLGFNYQISYADLVQQLTGVALAKKHTRANWTRRPLSRDELDYAMDDVRYLLQVYTRLQAELEQKNRTHWIEKELAAMSRAENYQIDASVLWKRLKGVQKLKGVALQIACDLCQWRERVAQRQNRPRRWIAKDDAIVELARRKPADPAELARVPELPKKTILRHGPKLLRIIADSTAVDAAQWPRQDTIKSLDSAQLALGDCLMGLCRVIAQENQIALATLATRKDIDNLILNQKSSRLAQGWRFAMAGEQLFEFLHGQKHIAVEEQKIKLK